MTAQRFFELSRRPIYAGRLVAYRIYELCHPGEPWIAQGAVRFLEEHLDGSCEALEWGSGRSTLWFARRVNHLVSVEHDRRWYQNVRASLEKVKAHNVDYQYIPLNHPVGEPTRAVYPEQPAYVRAAEKLADESLGLVIIDGHYRQACVLACLSKLKPGGLLVIDNTDWMPLVKWGVPAHWPLVHQSQNVRTQTTIWRKADVAQCA
jgi:predicted O-methyltransferase YrrM